MPAQKECADAVCERAHVSGGEQESERIIGDDFSRAIKTGCRAGKPAGHRFDQCNAKAFIAGWQSECIQRVQEGWNVIDVSAEADVVLQMMLPDVGLQFIIGILLPRGNVSCKAAGKRRKFGQKLFNGLHQKILPLFLRKETCNISDDKGLFFPVSSAVGELSGCRGACIPQAELIGVDRIIDGGHLFRVRRYRQNLFADGIGNGNGVVQKPFCEKDRSARVI